MPADRGNELQAFDTWRKGIKFFSNLYQNPKIWRYMNESLAIDFCHYIYQHNSSIH